jgi:hypothetical protein
MLHGGRSCFPRVVGWTFTLAAFMLLVKVGVSIPLESNQPVFYAYSHERLGDIVALDVRLVDEANPKFFQSVKYWFKPPKDIGRDGYTDWMYPVSEEHPTEENSRRPFFWRLTNGMEMPIFPVSNNTPKVRFSLLSDEQFSLSLNSGRAIQITALNRHLSEKPEPDELFRLIPIKLEKIPRC